MRASPAVASDGFAPGPNAHAEAHELVAWTVDPVLINGFNTQANTHLGGVYLAAGTVVSGLSVCVGTAGAGMTHGQLGIYDAGQNLLVSTPDSPAAFQGTGWVVVNFAKPWVARYSGLYYFGSTFTGTTLPAVGNVASQTQVTGPLPNGVARGVHAQVSNTLPTKASSQGTFTLFPCIVGVR